MKPSIHTDLFLSARVSNRINYVIWFMFVWEGQSISMDCPFYSNFETAINKIMNTSLRGAPVPSHHPDNHQTSYTDQSLLLGLTPPLDFQPSGQTRGHGS